jgi:hypothetical protein
VSLETPISDDLIRRYSTGPSKGKVDHAKSLRADVEAALGSDYKTFLQGSYRNDTGVADLNDLDVVALSMTVSDRTVKRGPAADPSAWDAIFQRVEDCLDAHARFAGLVKRGDKCVKVSTSLGVDVIPAVHTRSVARSHRGVLVP